MSGVSVRTMWLKNVPANTTRQTPAVRLRTFMDIDSSFFDLVYRGERPDGTNAGCGSVPSAERAGIPSRGGVLAGDAVLRFEREYPTRCRPRHDPGGAPRRLGRVRGVELRQAPPCRR